MFSYFQPCLFVKAYGNGITIGKYYLPNVQKKVKGAKAFWTLLKNCRISIQVHPLHWEWDWEWPLQCFYLSPWVCHQVFLLTRSSLLYKWRFLEMALVPWHIGQIQSFLVSFWSLFSQWQGYQHMIELDSAPQKKSKNKCLSAGEKWRGWRRRKTV